MDAKHKHDLHNPPPIPGQKNPPAPKPELPEEKPKPKKKRGGLLPGLLAGVILAGAVFALYRTVHFWSDATCVSRAKCSICGLEQEGYADHTWVRSSCDEPMTCSVCNEVGEAPAGHDFAGGSCTEPGACTICGEAQADAPGHTYQDGICTVCGAELTDTILKWEDKGYNAGYRYDAEACALTVTAPWLNTFLADDIALRDYAGETVRTERYTVSRSETDVTIHLPKDLAPGRYTICSGYFETEVVDFYLGTYDQIIPSAADRWFADFETKNLQHGLYLAAFEENAPLRGVQTEEEATRFVSPWQMSGAAYAEDSRAVLMQGGNKQKFVVDAHMTFSSSGQEETVYTFRYDDWYLAMDVGGKVYLTDTLAQNCCWIITSSL